VKVVCLQTSKPGHQLSPLAGQWFSCKSGWLVPAIGFAEQNVSDILPEQVVGSVQQSVNRRDAANHKMRVRKLLREILAGCVKDGVAGLNGDLRSREIGPDQDVDV
jgi:hypothetical protein